VSDFEEEVAVVVRRNGNGSVLAYDDRERAEDAFDNHREVLRSLYDLVDRRHGSDGDKVARLEVVDDGIGEILVRDGFVRDIETDRALALADDMRHYAEGSESRELVTDGGVDQGDGGVYQDSRYCCMDCGCEYFEEIPGPRDRCNSCGSLRGNQRGRADV